jgi:hypothetical protein
MERERPRRDTTVEVPGLVGLAVPAARALGRQAGVVVVAADQDGPPLSALTWPGRWLVTAQRPAAGTLVARGGDVVIDFEERPGGGGAGDREPGRPLPDPDALRAASGPGAERSG